MRPIFQFISYVKYLGKEWCTKNMKMTQNECWDGVGHKGYT